MNRHHPCDLFALENVLLDDCDSVQQSDIEQHLEHCESCQARLSRLAADEEFWTQTATNLSTVEQMELPPRLTSRLNATSSFVVPTILDESEQAFAPSHISSHSYAMESDWIRILDPPSHPEMLGRIDQFEVEAKIGQGGMGIVLKGFDRELNRAVAIKVLAPYLASHGTARKRFAREAQAAAAVVHPNVVPIYSVNSSPSRPYIVMQLVPGNTLQTLVRENGPLEPKDIVRVAMQVAAGLAAAHKQGLIHRDVKPGNILIERDVSRVMITDFGLARAADDAGLTQTGWLAGTPHYMSPEQSRGDDVDPRSDLFSLGSLMYFLATGREPFRGDKPYAVIQKIINHRPAHVIELNSEIPGPLADVIDKLLEKNPKNRFQSANEVRQILEHYLAHLQQPKKTRAPKRILTQRRLRQRIGIAASVFSLMVISTVAYFLISGRGRSETAPASGNLSTSIVGNPFSGNGAPPPVSGGPAETNSSVTPEALPAWALDDQEFSQQLNSLSEDLDQLEKSLNQTLTLGVDRAGPSESSPAFQQDANEVESEIQRLESRFQSETQFRLLIDQINRGSKDLSTDPTPLEPQAPESESSNQPATKRKLDED